MREPTMNQWAVIKWGKVYASVQFDHRDPKKWYWGGSFSWCCSEKKVEIVKDYGYISSDNYKKIDEIELDFYKNFNVSEKSDPIESGGWVAPDGSFFPCKFFEHDAYAKSLAAIYHDSLDGIRTLTDFGWLRISDSGFSDVKYHAGKITQKQLDTLYDLFTVAEDVEYKKLMKFTLELAIEKKNEVG